VPRPGQSQNVVVVCSASLGVPDAARSPAFGELRTRAVESQLVEGKQLFINCTFGRGTGLSFAAQAYRQGSSWASSSQPPPVSLATDCPKGGRRTFLIFWAMPGKIRRSTTLTPPEGCSQATALSPLWQSLISTAAPARTRIVRSCDMHRSRVVRLISARAPSCSQLM
jgi:hypothetical protein